MSQSPTVVDTFRHDATAGITVALVSIPQCMAFATIAGLEPANGLYAAVVMGAVGALASGCSKLNIGPAVTISSMVFSLLATVAPNEQHRWPGLAALLAILTGMMVLAGTLLRIGRLARFVSRSVLLGLMVCAAMLIGGSQLAPALGLPAVRKASLLGILIEVSGSLPQADMQALLFSTSTFIVILAGTRLLPRWPIPFLAIVLGAVVFFMLKSWQAATVSAIPQLPEALPSGLTPLPADAFSTDLLVGAAALALVSIIQTLAISRAMSLRDPSPTQDIGRTMKQDLVALGLANVLTGLLHGFAGAASFARTALNDVAGARTRVAGLINAIAIVGVAAIAAPGTRYVTNASIAGLLFATAISIVDWREVLAILRRERHERPVLLVMPIAVFVLPLHWVILIGLSVSIVIFLRRVSSLRMVEMVRARGATFSEMPLDAETGRSQITFLQVEGPLFFAQADELREALRNVFERCPNVTIIRMRRTQQIDFSVVAVLEQELQRYHDAGGRVILCGLTAGLRRTILKSALRTQIAPEHVLETTGTIFGSAQAALDLAEAMLTNDDPRPRMRTITEPIASAEATPR